MKRQLFPVFGGIFLLFVQSGLATIAIVDQQNTVGGTLGSIFSTAGTGGGQSFTPSLPSVNVADFSLLSPSGSATVRLDIFSGAGFGGTLLGSSAPVTFTNTSLQTIELNFLSPVTLTPGNTYTFRGTIISGSYQVELTNSNPYPGGSGFNESGISSGTVDVVFAEGLQAVPEPATTGLFLFGAVALLWRIKTKPLASQRVQLP